MVVGKAVLCARGALRGGVCRLVPCAPVAPRCSRTVFALIGADCGPTAPCRLQAPARDGSVELEGLQERGGEPPRFYNQPAPALRLFRPRGRRDALRQMLKRLRGAYTRA